jgi:glycosyltransferase involved in cell wall biosynthesis
MRILWVKAGKLLPVDTGGKIRSYNLLRHLARHHQVTLLSYYGGERDPGYESEIRKELPGAQTIYTAAPDGNVVRQGLDYLKRLPKAAPYAVTKFTDAQVSIRVRRWLGEGRFDVAVCDFLSASLNFPAHLTLPCVLFQHNVESSLWERMESTESNPIRKLSFTIESAKMTRYERSALSRFHHVIAVSDIDRDQMLAMDGSCSISVVPTGVDTEKFTVAPPADIDPPKIAFVGSMDWEPNIDAAEYFCRDIWPQILAAHPNAQFQLIGRSPHPRVKRLASDSVIVTGTVPAVTDYLRDAAVVIVPLRIGGGTRLKIFEAMAMGKAVVSTTIGAEGLAVESGRDLLLADDAESFAESILSLLLDGNLRRKYEIAAAALAARYDWSKIAQRFAEILQTVAQNSHSQATKTS